LNGQDARNLFAEIVWTLKINRFESYRTLEPSPTKPKRSGQWQILFNFTQKTLHLTP